MSTDRKYFYVYQNKTYYEEKAGSFLWSPQFASGGRRNAGYETMRQVCPGDVIFHSYKSEIVAISIAKSRCYSAIRPSASFSEWELNGWKVDTEYLVFPSGITISDHIPELYKIQPSNGPYTASFRGKQQYLCSANKAIFDYIIDNVISVRTSPITQEKLKKFLED